MSLLPVSAIPSVGGYNINNSLRFRASASAYLLRTVSTTSNRRIFTYSCWVKRSQLGAVHQLFGANSGNIGTTGTLVFNLQFDANDTILIAHSTTNVAVNWSLTTTQLFRDPSAWYHIILAVDTTQATSSNRVKLYVNGSQVTSFSSATYPALNFDGAVNFTGDQKIGSLQWQTTELDGYMAEIHFVNAQQLTPSSFGETDTTTGVWKPKAYTGTYGTNGFYLPFSDTSVTPTLVNQSATQRTTSASTVNINVPTGTKNGDLMIAILTAGTSTTATWTTPAGWTAGFTSSNSRAVFYRTASAEPASYTFTASNSSTHQGYIFTYRNAAWDKMSAITAASNPTVTASITTAANDAVLLYYAGIPTNAGVTYTAPTGFTVLASDSDATLPSSAVFSRVQNVAGATGTVSCTGSTTNNRAFIISIIPSGTYLGRDFSGNDNYFITNNISVTSGITYDAMIDSPTLTSATVSNYCVMNPLDNGNTLSNGNLNVAGAVDRLTRSTFGMSSGKWYCEVFISSVGSSCHIGIATAAASSTAYLGGDAFGWSYGQSGLKWTNGTAGVTYGASYTTNDIIGIAFDADTGSLTFYKNGTTQGVAFTGLTSGPYFFAVSASSPTVVFNFGQRPFTYTPPTGFNRLNTFNLPDSTIVKGNSFMDATTYTGTGASLSITNAAGFRPDFVWVKGRSGATDHALYDAVRGTTNDLVSNSTAAATTQAQGLTAFNSNGFTVGTLAKLNTNTATYVGWQWQAGSSTVTNTSGTISSQVRANTTTGFSIVTYTGTGANATVGHGLGVAPAMVIVKRRNGTGNWQVRHRSIAAASSIQLNLTNAAASATTVWNSTAPTSTVFSIGTATTVNANTDTYVAYCWAEIAGFSAFGSYIGNGSTDGPFVYLGFRPKFIMFKGSSFATEWNIYDTSRSSYNLLGARLDANTASSEASTAYIDTLSNGFKFRTSLMNDNGQTFIYAAFAENPFKNSLAR